MSVHVTLPRFEIEPVSNGYVVVARIPGTEPKKGEPVFPTVGPRQEVHVCVSTMELLRTIYKLLQSELRP